MYRSRVQLLVLGLAALLTGCVFAVPTPGPGEPLQAPAGKSLVFGRVQVVTEGGREYRPWDPADVPSPNLHLMLLRLGPRELAPGMPFHNDGRFYWWLQPGDYALVGSSHDLSATATTDLERQDMTVLALLRAPRGQAASYAGDLEITLVDVDVHRSLELHFDFGPTTVLDRRNRAIETLARSFGQPEAEPVVTPMCAGDEVPAFSDPQLAARARRLLDAGCRQD